MFLLILYNESQRIQNNTDFENVIFCMQKNKTDIKVWNDLFNISFLFLGELFL